MEKYGFIFLISLFFIVTITLTTAIGSYYNETINPTLTDVNDTGLFQNIFNNFITGFDILPVWLNLVIYGSLLTTTIFIIVGSLPLMNG